jgi:glucose-1-phosphate adenylyltransferase
LYPLTRDRAKPAVFFGGPYRIIDFTLSNCINSGLRRIFIATQYNRCRSTATFAWAGASSRKSSANSSRFCPPQKRVSEHWYQGTADAVYQNLYSIVQEARAHVIVLSGDHVYKMDYAGCCASTRSAAPPSRSPPSRVPIAGSHGSAIAVSGRAGQ